MLTVVSTFVVVDSTVLGGCALVQALRRRGPGPALVGGLALLELVVVARAVLDGLTMAGGAPTAEPEVHVGYLLASVALLPLLAGVTRAGRSERPGAWDTAVLAVACAALAVVSVRLVATGLRA